MDESSKVIGNGFQKTPVDAGDIFTG